MRSKSNIQYIDATISSANRCASSTTPRGKGSYKGYKNLCSKTVMQLPAETQEEYKSC